MQIERRRTVRDRRIAPNSRCARAVAGLAEFRQQENRGFAGLIRDSANFSTVIKNILSMARSKKIVETCDQIAYALSCEGQLSPAGTAPPLASLDEPFVSGVGHPLPALSA
jgi:hypothetical protein